MVIVAGMLVPVRTVVLATASDTTQLWKWSQQPWCYARTLRLEPPQEVHQGKRQEVLSNKRFI